MNAMAADLQECDGEDEKVQQGHVLHDFKEVEEVKEIISNLKVTCEPGPDSLRTIEDSYEKFLFIIDQYQEQPHLLDPHLESLLSSLLSICRDQDSSEVLVHEAFKLVYLLTKVRGYKNILRRLPHEVADMEPVLTMLMQQNQEEYANWETRYMLLLWLSIICMIPFDMSRFDSNVGLESGKKPIIERVLDTAKLYHDKGGAPREAAAYLISHFITRPDVKAPHLPEYITWALHTIRSVDTGNLRGMKMLVGVLTTLSLLFKHGKRSDLIEHGATVLETLLACDLKESKNSLLRKLSTKLIQRIGLIFLKAKVAAWRYQRGSRSLAGNLSLAQPAAGGDMATGNDDNEEEEDEEYDIPDEMEDVIENLLLGLKDAHTVVRWSAAKGIGRVTGRLPKELADEVVESVLELFTLAEGDAAWHGGCLAIAELGRRGLLLPQRLETVVPVVLKALSYDEMKGMHSVGSHVRDAACYVSWAFARAYEPQEIKPYVNEIASALVITSVFDREVNVRRAASAAFQENVGRQGTFPHGIDILTTCDYFAVGLRSKSYLELSVFVAQFPEYTRPLIDHLVQHKINHWDIEIRELTAKALFNLTCKDPDYMNNTVLPKLLPMTSSPELYLRHGSILCAAEITHALVFNATAEKTAVDILDPVIIQGLQDITRKLKDARLFRGQGGELMRKAVCTLIEKMSISKMPYKDSGIVEVWQDLLDDCLEHVEPTIQAAAVQALPAFCEQYYKQADGQPLYAVQEKLIEKYVKELKATLETTRLGYCSALGSLPKFFLKGKLQMVLAGLIQATKIKDKEDKKADFRRDSIKALAGICETVGVEAEGQASDCICQDNIYEVYDALLTAMNDYTMDARGDVGALVREASMCALRDVSSLTVKSAPSLLKPNIIEAIFCRLLQQCCEKIDRTRQCAGQVFISLLHHSPNIPNIPHKEDLVKTFPERASKFVNFAAPAITFPKFVKFLRLDTYRYHVLLGMIISSGGLTESLVKHSEGSLRDYLRKVSTSAASIETFCDTLLKVFKDHSKQQRVTLPMFRALNFLLSMGLVDMENEEKRLEFGQELFKLSKLEVSKQGNPQIVLASIEVFCGLLSFGGEVRRMTLSHLTLCLGHKYPIVRKTTANKLYEAVITFDDIVDEEVLDECMTIISETQWDHPLEEVRPIRNKLCGLMGLKIPVAAKSAAKTSAS